jgi:hypothetical protein
MVLVLGGTWDGRRVDWSLPDQGPVLRVPVLVAETTAWETYHVERLMVEGTPHWFLVHSSLRGGGISATEMVSRLCAYDRPPQEAA